MTISIDTALSIAGAAHNGQKDKGGMPYILHPIRVGMKLVKTHGLDVAIVGFLHDVVEDSSYTLENMKEEGLTEHQLDALDRVTKRDGETRRQNYERVRMNDYATAVKIADIEDNLDLIRIKNRRELMSKDLDRINDYLYGWSLLTGK